MIPMLKPNVQSFCSCRDKGAGVGVLNSQFTVYHGGEWRSQQTIVCRCTWPLPSAFLLVAQVCRTHQTARIEQPPQPPEHILLPCMPLTKSGPCSGPRGPRWYRRDGDPRNTSQQQPSWCSPPPKTIVYMFSPGTRKKMAAQSDRGRDEASLCAHVSLCPRLFVPTSLCAHVSICPGKWYFVPTSLCAQKSGILCPRLFVPTSLYAQTYASGSCG